MSIIKNLINKKILYLISDLRTNTVFNQVVGKTRHNYKVNDFIDIKLDFADNPNEWVLAKVVSIKDNVICLVIVKEVQ